MGQCCRLARGCAAAEGRKRRAKALHRGARRGRRHGKAAWGCGWHRRRRGHLGGGRLLAPLPLCPEHLRVLVPCCESLEGSPGGRGLRPVVAVPMGASCSPLAAHPAARLHPQKALYLSQLCLVFSPQGSALQLGRVLGLELASSPRTGALRRAHGATPAPRPRWGGAMPPGALHLKKAVPPLSTFTPSALFPLRAVGLQYFYRPGRFPVCNPRAHGCGRSDRGAGCPAPAPILPAPGHPSRGRGAETPSAVTLQGLSQLLSAAGRAGTAWGGSSRDRGSRGARSFALPAAFPQPLPSGSRIPGKKRGFGGKKKSPARLGCRRKAGAAQGGGEEHSVVSSHGGTSPPELGRGKGSR